MSNLWLEASGKIYYHASPHEFGSGDVITPGGSGRDTFGTARPRDKVYLSNSISDSQYWAMHIADLTGRTTHVYRVTAPETSRHYSKDVDGYEFRAPVAQVLAHVSSHEPGEW